MQKQTPKDILRGILFVYWAMVLGLATFIVVSSIFVSNMEGAPLTDPKAVYILKTVLIFILILLVPVSYVLPQRQIAKIAKGLPLTEKLNLYRTAAFTRLAVMNAAGVFTAIGFMLSAATNLIYLQAIVFLFFIIYKPSPFKIAADLELDEKQRRQIMPD